MQPSTPLSGFPDCPNPNKVLSTFVRMTAPGNREHVNNVAKVIEQGFLDSPGPGEPCLMEKVLPLMDGKTRETADWDAITQVILEHKLMLAEREAALAEALMQ